MYVCAPEKLDGFYLYLIFYGLVNTVLNLWEVLERLHNWRLFKKGSVP
jgi:hypothetical protein